MPSNQRSGSSTKVEESSLGDENGQKNDTSLDELHYLTDVDMLKITKKRPKPNKNEHEIVKTTQKPDLK
nr:HOPM interactor 7 [Tanacetum cinerariifolium]